MLGVRSSSRLENKLGKAGGGTSWDPTGLGGREGQLCALGGQRGELGLELEIPALCCSC